MGKHLIDPDSSQKLIDYKLKFREDHSFVIIQLTDLHFDYFNSYQEENIAKMRNIIQKVKPDLIVVTGDIVNDYVFK